MEWAAIIGVVIGVLLLLWGGYNMNLFFRKEGNRFTSMLAAIVLFVFGTWLIVNNIF